MAVQENNPIPSELALPEEVRGDPNSVHLLFAIAAKEMVDESMDPNALYFFGELMQHMLYREHLFRLRNSPTPRFANDVKAYELIKQIGILEAWDMVAPFDMQDESSFHISKGDQYLELHLPPVEETQDGFTKTTASLHSVADYIVEHDYLDPKYVIGLTYPKLAKASQFWGFTVITPPFPNLIVQLNEKIVAKLPNHLEFINRTLLAYQT
jgi:hypothetical protein